MSIEEAAALFAEGRLLGGIAEVHASAPRGE
jgi:hypothetical protein